MYPPDSLGSQGTFLLCNGAGVNFGSTCNHGWSATWRIKTCLAVEAPRPPKFGLCIGDMIRRQ
ncbi:hypothetical protein TSMEX_007744 [Taenia solium]|eukprot:TsM_000433700 transcript=TsM_000433700 gene=TsM_000433700